MHCLGSSKFVVFKIIIPIIAFIGYSHAVFSPEKDVMRNLCRVLTSSVLCDTSFRPVASENKELAYQKSNGFFLLD